MKLTKLKISAVALFLILVASIGSMESSTPFMKPAMAQDGSRLCGWMSRTEVLNADGTVGPGVMGILFEARQSYNSYTSNCSNAANGAESKIKTDVNLSKITTWEKVYKAECDPVGTYFASGTHPGTDMCRNMEAHKMYMVKKIGNQTTYAPL
jgi:hypothetical protein